MRRILLLCACALFLSGIAYIAFVPATAAGQDSFPDTPEGWVKLYEDEAKRCANEAYDLNLELQRTRRQVEESRGAPMLVLAWTYTLRDYREACADYHHYIRQAAYARSHLPTPTPTATPIPTTSSPDPRDPRRMPSPSGTGTLPIWPRDENDLHVKFITDQRRKLRELKDRADKLIKEAKDFLNKAKATKTKPPKPGYKTEFDSTSGLFIVKFTTPAGVLRVHLPEDMRPGDKISGSVTREPNGETKEVRARNWADLNQYQLAIANSRPGANDFILKLFRTNTPKANTGTVSTSVPSEQCACPFGFSLSASGQIVSVEQPANVPSSAEPASCVEGCPAFLAYGSVLDNISGDATTMEAQYLKELTEAQVQEVYDNKGAQDPRSEPKPKGFQFPSVGQNGSSVEIRGPFDGNLRTTDIRIGGQPVIKLAESPRNCIFKSPEQDFGPADITLKENNVEARGTYRNLGVRLSAPKTSLLKGETTNVTIEVSGLAGIKQDVPLHLEAQGVINMAGGSYQYLSIRPQDVTPDGRFTTTRTITGQMAGGFGVTATVINSESKSTERTGNVSRVPQPFSVLRTTGNVSTTSGGTSVTAPPFGNVKAGDTVKTGADGVALLECDTKEQTTQIVLDHNTEVSYEPEKEDPEEKDDCPEKKDPETYEAISRRLGEEKKYEKHEDVDPDIEVPQFDLKEGSALKTVLRKARQKGIFLKIKTNMGHGGVCGTEFYSMKDAYSFRIVVTESSVWMRDTDKKKITVNAMQMGFITVWEKMVFRETGTAESEKLAEEQARAALYATVNSLALDDKSSLMALTITNNELADKLKHALQTGAILKTLPKVGNKFVVAVEFGGMDLKKLIESLTGRPMGKHAVGVTSALPDGVMSRIEELRKQFKERRPAAK